MKKIILIVFIILTGFVVFSQEVNIPPGYFLNRKFGTYESLPGLCISMHFINENEVIMAYSHPHCGSCGFPCQIAQYKIRNNRLIIYYDIEYGSSGSNIVNLVFSLQKSDKSFYFNNFIKLENPFVLENKHSKLFLDEIDILWDYNSRIKPGIIRNIKGVNTVVLTHSIAAVTEGLRIREAPSTDARIYTIYLDEYEEGLLYLPAGARKVKILGRTQNMVSIGDWTNYWYYIEIQFHMVDGAEMEGESNYTGKRDFWAFGEFLEIEHEVNYDGILDNIPKWPCF